MVDDKKYADFVLSVTSDYSRNQDDLQYRLNKLEQQRVNVPALLTAALGLTGEAGEFADHVKKIILHGKDDFFPERREKMILELGDVMWYVMQACRGLDISLDEIVQMNIEKLSNRHNEGTFKKDY